MTIKLLPLLFGIFATTFSFVLLVSQLFGESSARRSRGIYIETFDNGPGGWFANRLHALPVWDGVAYCFGPWFVDANHAPPGAGYLHLVMWLYTTARGYQSDPKSSIGLSFPYTTNSFVEQKMSTNLTNAKLTVHLRGEIDLKGAQLLFLVQARTGRFSSNYAFTGQPFRITREWSEQTVTLAPDPNHWTCLGARRELSDSYGCAGISEVLSDVNNDIIFILFPLKVVPAAGKVVQDPHGEWAGRRPKYAGTGGEYPIDQEFLPKGLIMFDTVKIEYFR